MRFVVALLLVSGAILVACGQPPVTTAAPVSSVVSLAGLNACALLTDTQLTALGQATTGQPSGSSGSHCLYPAARTGGSQLTIELVSGPRTGKDPSDQRVTVGTHTAVRSELPMTSQCSLDVLAGQNIVMVIGTGSDACTLATAAARLIEPNLP
jgi:hypothetical protein